MVFLVLANWPLVSLAAVFSVVVTTLKAAARETNWPLLESKSVHPKNLSPGTYFFYLIAIVCTAIWIIYNFR